MLISETLTAAKAIIASPATWTQWHHAINEKRKSVRINDPEATCFCLDAAIAKAAGVKVNDAGGWDDTDHYHRTSECLRDVAEELTGQSSYVGINDGEVQIEDLTAHEATLFLLDKGIEKARQREIPDIVDADPCTGEEIEIPASWSEVVS